MSSIWRREFHATRTSAHVAFAAIAWPILTVIGATLALIELPYYSVTLDKAFKASLGGLVLIVPDMIVVGAAAFGLSGVIFSRLGVETRGRELGYLRLGLEPLVMLAAVVFGAAVWYPAVVGKPIFFPFHGLPAIAVVAIFGACVVAGALAAARPGKRIALAAVMLAVGLLAPVPLRIRAELERVMGRPSDLVVLGIDSMSYDEDNEALRHWVARRGGTWYEHAVAPALMTNAVWSSILTMRPVREHGIFHTFQRLPEGQPALLAAARAKGYRTVSVFPDQLTCDVGSKAGFDEDRSGPIGWRQILLQHLAESSFLIPVFKPALPAFWPSLTPPNHSGTFTYDVTRDVRSILRAGSREKPTFVAAHLTYTHIAAYPSLTDLSWEELERVALAPAGEVRDRSFDWQDSDHLDDPLLLHAWKLKHVQEVVASEVDRQRFLEHGRLLLFSDHGDRAGLGEATFQKEHFFHVPLATFGVPSRCTSTPISLIDIGALVGLADSHAVPAVEYALAPQPVWPQLVRSARLRWDGEVDLDPGLLAFIFSGLRRFDPWPELQGRTCSSTTN